MNSNIPVSQALRIDILRQLRKPSTPATILSVTVKDADKETIMHGHDRHNTSVLSVVHDVSTTCFGQY